ncbi:4Fe-4S dicluster domain-containing protein [candidate division WS5 bacterium]|uniref:4Fe-4S dicluster domain-containing protein n=1 Tax=candidate division WS5 bacterium TaxID=2093353 RepID=A0A419DG07_9BACT|nr:MAG: 4Fe-4S dicluster domain-containing protein [candidate division WS5 bacterium]
MRDYKGKTYSDSKKEWTNFSELCKGCGLCIEKCPQECLSADNSRTNHYGTSTVKCDIGKCIACGICEIHCPDMAIRVDKK